MSDAFLEHLRGTLAQIEADGLTKRERLIDSPQRGRIRVAGPNGTREMVNLCANNYLGLADHPEVTAAARAALDRYGFGMASVRFICGTQTLHRELDCALARFSARTTRSCSPPVSTPTAACSSRCSRRRTRSSRDSLNHASIIDGIRLSKAKRWRFANSDMDELETRLKEADAAGARFKLIATDGVFSMDGYVAKLPEICDLAERHGALVLVDDCHATGHRRR